MANLLSDYDMVMMLSKIQIKSLTSLWNFEKYISLSKMIHIVYFILTVFYSHVIDARSLCPGDRLNIKMSSYQYKDSRFKDKTVSQPSYLYNAIHHTLKDGLVANNISKCWGVPTNHDHFPACGNILHVYYIKVSDFCVVNREHISLEDKCKLDLDLS